MQALMAKFVDRNRQEILSGPLEVVGIKLREMCASYERGMTKNVEVALERIREDYQSALLSREAVTLPESNHTSSLHVLQNKIRDMLLKADGEFEEGLLSRNGMAR